MLIGIDEFSLRLPFGDQLRRLRLRQPQSSLRPLVLDDLARAFQPEMVLLYHVALAHDVEQHANVVRVRIQWSSH